MTYTFIKTVTVPDPDTDGDVEVEIWKDNTSGGIMGIDASFLDQCPEFYNPFNGEQNNIDEVMPVA